MAEAVDQVEREFWRAPLPASAAASERSATCHCGSEFIVSSVYCHVCGVRRPGVSVMPRLALPSVPDLASIAERLGLKIPAAIAFFLGVLCVIGAFAVSVFFSSRTLLDWQAIQLWRIEWLLAACAAFVAGCLLKK